VFAYFNNDWHGFALRNALDLAATLQVGMAEPAAAFDGP
jgi:hypothetical protein